MSLKCRLRRLERRARRAGQALMLAGLVAVAASAPAVAAPVAGETPDHVHLKLTLVLAPSQPRAAGDALGIHALEMLACNTDKTALAPRGWLRAGLDRVTDMVVGSAWASHRDRFDRPGAKVVMIPVPLDGARTIPLGELIVPHGRYCRIRLTLTRLPGTTQPKVQAPLDTSVHLARPGSLPALAVAYPVPLELPLAKPWQARHGAAAATITLDPGAANDVLADASLSEGALVRRVTERWVERSQVVVASTR